MFISIFLLAFEEIKSDDINLFEHDNLMYCIEKGNKASLCKVNENYIKDQNIIIISYVGDQLAPVYKIHKHVFKGLTKIKTIIFPRSLEIIPNSCFKNCANLERVKLAHTKLQCITNNCFRNCINLEYISLPPSIQYIGKCAFLNCRRLQNIKTNSLKQNLLLMPSCFMNCTSLKNATFLKDAHSIESYAFANCINLSDVLFNEISLVKLSSHAFYKCRSINKIIITKSIKIIEDNCFAGTNLKHFVIPSWVEYVGPFLLQNCTSLLELEIYISEVPNSMASCCTRLHTIKISGNLLKIGQYAFENTKINHITFTSQLKFIGKGAFLNSHLFDIDLLKTQVKKIKSETFRGCFRLNTVFLNQYTISIGSEAFKDSRLSKITNTENIQKLGARCFENTKLASISLVSPNLIDVPIRCFADSKLLEFVTISEFVTSLGYQAFKNTAIKHFNLSKAQNIGDEIFQNCKNLYSVQFDKQYYISRGMFDGCSNLQDFSCPYKLESIEANAFRSSGINSIIIYENVNYIGPFAFSFCKQLTEFKIYSDLITELPKGIFYSTSISLYRVPPTITSLGKKAFAYSKIQTLILHNGIKIINDLICKKCDLLKEVILHDNNYSDENNGVIKYKYNTTIDIEIRKRAFFGCVSLQRFNFSNVVLIGQEAFSLTSIEEFYGPPKLNILEPSAFSHSKLKKVNLEKCATLNSIPQCCFMCCTNLCSVIFGESIKAIGRYSFMLCPITHLSFPRKIKIIEPASFIWLPRLISVDLSKMELTRLPRLMFVHCRILKNITLPMQIEDADKEFIQDCHSLENIQYFGTNAPVFPKIFKGLSAFVSYNFQASSLLGATNIIHSYQKWNSSDYSLKCSDVKQLEIRFTIQMKDMHKLEDGYFDSELLEKAHTDIGDINIKKELINAEKIIINNRNMFTKRIPRRKANSSENINKTMSNETQNTPHVESRSKSKSKSYFKFIATLFVIAISVALVKSMKKTLSFDREEISRSASNSDSGTATDDQSKHMQQTDLD